MTLNNVRGTMNEPVVSSRCAAPQQLNVKLTAERSAEPEVTGVVLPDRSPSFTLSPGNVTL